MSSLNEESPPDLAKRTSNSLPRNMCLCDTGPKNLEKVSEKDEPKEPPVDDCSTDDESVTTKLDPVESGEKKPEGLEVDAKETCNETVDELDGSDKVTGWTERSAGKSCSERSDSGISDCSVLAACSCSSTPLLGKKFQINEEAETVTRTAKHLISDDELDSSSSAQVLLKSSSSAASDANSKSSVRSDFPQNLQESRNVGDVFSGCREEQRNGELGNGERVGLKSGVNGERNKVGEVTKKAAFLESGGTITSKSSFVYLRL